VRGPILTVRKNSPPVSSGRKIGPGNPLIVAYLPKRNKNVLQTWQQNNAKTDLKMRLHYRAKWRVKLMLDEFARRIFDKFASSKGQNQLSSSANKSGVLRCHVDIVLYLRAVSTRVFCSRFRARNGVDLPPLLFSRDHVREKAKEAVGQRRHHGRRNGRKKRECRQPFKGCLYSRFLLAFSCA
jgi:hypothetical protein